MQQISAHSHLRLTALIGSLAAFVTLSVSACGDDSGGGDGGAGGGGIVCDGGLLLEDGSCVPKCDPAKCVEGNTCVGNVCVLQCTGHGDCGPGQQCGAVLEDDTNAEIGACQLSCKSGFIGLYCPFGTECDDKFACPTGESCGASVCGGGECVADPTLCPADDPECALGTCAADGTVCFVPSCAADACRALTCLSAGVGDAEAVCTNQDCQGDLDCGPGFYCGTTRDPQMICGTDKGEVEPCIDPANFAAAGATYQEGPASLLRNTCIPRPQCAACESDLDCSPVIGWDGTDGAVSPLGEQMRCIPIGEGNHCAQTCATAGDCDPDYACATDIGLCVPKFGACTGTGAYCDPCLNDLDCSGAEGSSICLELSGNQTACFDLSFPDTCTSDNDCPMSAGGFNGECLDEGEGLTSTDGAYHRCYVPFDSGASKFGCWGN